MKEYRQAAASAVLHWLATTAVKVPRLLVNAAASQGTPAATPQVTPLPATGNQQGLDSKEKAIHLTELAVDEPKLGMGAAEDDAAAAAEEPHELGCCSVLFPPTTATSAATALPVISVRILQKKVASCWSAGFAILPSRLLFVCIVVCCLVSLCRCERGG
jgi:hypothetical protein